MKQENLFSSDNPNETEKSVKTLSNKKKLTKEQQQFYRLTKKIEALQKEIEELRKKLPNILLFYEAEFEPLIKKQANLDMEVAMIVGNSIDKYKYGKKQLKDIKEFVLYMCDKVFSQIEPNKKQKEFFDKWSDVSYDEELKNQMKEGSEMFSYFMKEQFNLDVDINLEDYMNDPSDFEKFSQKILEEKNKNDEKKSKRKKTSKQLQQEEIKKAQEEIKNKNIRSIYITLAKLLHPDTETDATRKIEKENIMKEVTNAYEKKDLFTLLKLEMEWVNKENENIEKLTQENLKIYNSVLKEQVKELEYEMEATVHQPVFSKIGNLVYCDEEEAKANIMETCQEQKKENKFKLNIIQNIKEHEEDTKYNILDIINQFKKELAHMKQLRSFFDKGFKI